MKLQKLLGILLPLFVLGLFWACKGKDSDPTEYIKGIENIAVEYNKNCPKDQANGTRLESVTFKNNTLTYCSSLSDEAIITINLDDTRDSIIKGMSDNLRKFLAKGKCNLVYKYVSPNDSSSITIVPNELGYIEPNGK